MKRLFCLLALLLLTGCGGDELQRFTIVTAAAVDVRDDLYRVTVEGTGQRLDETGRPELLSGLPVGAGLVVVTGGTVGTATMGLPSASTR